MAIDLAPADHLDVDPAITEFVDVVYCGNCVHVSTEDGAYCSRWDAPTELKPGWICPEYMPQGYAPPDR